MSRDAILAKVKAAAADSGLPDADSSHAERIARVEGRLAAREQTAPTPQIARLDGRARIDRFINAAKAIDATVSRHHDLRDIPKAIADELRKRNAGPQLRMGDDPELARLAWEGLEVTRGAGRLEEPATVSRAVAASAETGTLVLFSGVDNPVTLTFLGDIHFVVLRASDVEAGFEGVWRRYRSSGDDPRTVNFVTGPSRTADIEQTIELGAHGPIDLHIFLIDDV